MVANDFSPYKIQMDNPYLKSNKKKKKSFLTMLFSSSFFVGGAFLTVLALSGLACLIVIWGYNHKVKKENNTDDLHASNKQVLGTYKRLIQKIINYILLLQESQGYGLNIK